MKCIGNTVIGPNGRVESRSLGVEELAYVLDVLLVANKVKQGSWGFPDLVTMLDSVTKVNPHQHITGSIGDPDLLRRVIQVYRQDQSARSAFLEYVLQSFIVREDEIPGFFEQSDDALVPWFQRKVPLAGDPWDFDEADDRLSLTRLAFQSQSPDSWELLQEAYRTVALENAAHGVEEVWFRTSLGDHQKDSFVRAAGQLSAERNRRWPRLNFRCGSAIWWDCASFRRTPETVPAISLKSTFEPRDWPPR
jgi:hypothetical protein